MFLATQEHLTLGDRYGRAYALIQLAFVVDNANETRRAEVEDESWDEIGRLAAIAAIRTALNYVLQREITEDARMVSRIPEAMQIVLGSAVPVDAQT